MTRPLTRLVCELLALALVTGGTILRLSAQPAAPICDEALTTQYRQLVSDKLVPEQPGAPAWSQQLVTLVTQLRTSKTLLDIKKQQADLAEQNVAQLLEQLRQAQVQNGDLRREVEALKQGSKPPGN